MGSVVFRRIHRKWFPSHVISSLEKEMSFSETHMRCFFFLFHSFEKSIFQEEEEFFQCGEVSLPGVTLSSKAERGEEESAEHGQPRW